MARAGIPPRRFAWPPSETVVRTILVVSVRGFFRRQLLQAGRQVRLLARAQFDTSVDTVLGILKRAFAAGQIFSLARPLLAESQELGSATL